MKLINYYLIFFETCSDFIFWKLRKVSLDCAEYCILNFHRRLWCCNWKDMGLYKKLQRREEMILR